MPYVMVPVPEEHVREAMEAILRIIARAGIVQWTEESFGDLFAEIDEPSRSVLSAAAKAAQDERRLSDEEASQTTELGIREIHTIIRDLNDLAREGNHPPVVYLSTVPVTLPNGRTRDQRTLTMSPEIVELVQAAEAAEHAELKRRLSKTDA